MTTPETTATSCRFRLLGLRVIVASECEAVVERLPVCYGIETQSPWSGPKEPPLRGRVSRDGSAWRIQVDGRTGVTAPDAAEALRALNHELLHGVMLRRRQFLYVHAGVVAVDDRAIVLPGLSQAGKSTLVLALLARGGVRYLSDELLVYDPGTDRCLPYLRAAKVRDECVGYFSGSALAAGFDGQGEGRFLRFGAMSEDMIATGARPALVVAPRWDPDGDDVPVAISAGETLLRLVSSTLNFGMRKTGSVDELAHLSGRVRGCDLAWRDPHAAAAALLEHLRQGPLGPGRAASARST